MSEIDYKSLFEAASGLYLILSRDFTILTANNSYCKATLTNCDEIKGRNLFEVFPDNPDDPSADGVRNLRASLNFVLKNKVPHSMAIQKYDVRKADGTFELKYWSPINTPVLNKDGDVDFIIHNAVDVTEFIAMKNEQIERDKLTKDLQIKVEMMESDIFKRAKEIQELNIDLEKKISERTEELTRSEKKYKYLFQNNPLPMWIIDLETFRFIDVNDAATMHYGYSYDEFLSMTAYDIRPEEDREQFTQLDRPEKISAGNYNRGIWRHIKKNGTIIYVEIFAHEISIAGKDCRFILSNDVTEKINAEKKLLESIREIRDYKYALDESSIIAISDETGKLTYVNDNFCRVSKFSKEEILSGDYSVVSSNYHSADFIKNLWNTISGGNIWRGELKNKAKDGTIYWVDSTIVPFINERGKPYRYVTINKDITHKKLTDDLLTDTGLLAKIGGWELVLNNMTVRWTEEVSRIHGLKAGIMPSLKDALNFYAPKVRPIIEEAISNIIAKGENFDLELPLITAHGKHLWVRVIGKADFENGIAARVYGVFQDITAQKEAKDEIQKLNEGLEEKVKLRTAELESAIKELEAFSYTVSHDLRAPLRAVNGYARILEDDFSEKLGEEGKRRIDIIKSNAKNMGMLIDDLLAFSRLGRKELEKSYIDMTSLARLAFAEIDVTLNHNAKVKIDKLHPSMADGVLMKQALINLLSNALKYSAKVKEPLIEVSSNEAADKIIYTIKDNGAGFDMSYVHKIFGIFERLHTIDEFEGTGVGLAIVHRIIARHGGEIWAEGEINKGASFHFSLPKV